MGLSASSASSSRGMYEDRGPEGSRARRLLSPAPLPEAPPGIPLSLRPGPRDEDEGRERRGPPALQGRGSCLQDLLTSEGRGPFTLLFRGCWLHLRQTGAPRTWVHRVPASWRVLPSCRPWGAVLGTAAGRATPLAPTR